MPDCGENKLRRIARVTRSSDGTALDALLVAERVVNEFADRRMTEFEQQRCPTDKDCNQFRSGHKTKRTIGVSITYDFQRRRNVATVRVLYEVVYYCDKNPPPPAEDEEVEEEEVDDEVVTPPVVAPPTVTPPVTPPPTTTPPVVTPPPAPGAWCTGTVNFTQGVTPGVAVGTAVCFPCPGPGGCLDRAELHYTRYPLSGVGIIIVQVNRGACGACPVGSVQLNPPEFMEFGWRVQRHD